MGKAINSFYRLNLHNIRILFIILLIFLSICHRVQAQTYDEWIELSFQYVDANQLDSAEIALKNALRIEPANQLNPFIFSNLGTIQRRMKKKEEALFSYSAALSHHPKNEVFLNERASLFSETGQFQNALIDYNTLLEENPNNQEALYQRGLLYLTLKNYERAEKDFAWMLELNPNSLFARLGFASLYKISGNYDGAEKTYNYILDKEPENPAAYAGRAELYLLLEKPGKAVNDVNKAIRLSQEENPYLYIIRTKARLLLHEKKAAEED
ncbi:MAG: tetratricopeptide repeat protein, partial [Bacteroidales bacterium]|nr:tetratricopeptide repeat protein [Bacteroidales bacterium]